MFHLTNMGSFSENQTRHVCCVMTCGQLFLIRFHAAETVLGLDYLHCKGVIHRYITKQHFHCLSFMNYIL